MPRQRSGEQLSRQKHNGRTLDEDVHRQVVWTNDGLYNSCRCVLSAPLIREGVKAAAGAGLVHYAHIGVIKVENRSPFGVTGYSEIPTIGNVAGELFYRDEWAIASLRPYVRDLQRQSLEGADPYEPLVNDIGWQQYFQDHDAGRAYYEKLLSGLTALKKKALHKREDVPEPRYKEFENWLHDLVECLIRLESWIQHLRAAIMTLCGMTDDQSVDRPLPSLFNVHNLRSAVIADPSIMPRATFLGKDAFTDDSPMHIAILDPLLACVATGGMGEIASIRREVLLLEMLRAIERVIVTRTEVSDDSFREINLLLAIARDTPAYVQYTTTLNVWLGWQQGATGGSGLRQSAAQDSPMRAVEALRVMIRNSLDARIDKAFAARVKRDRQLLYDDDEFKVDAAILGEEPAWRLTDIVKEAVLDDLRNVSTAVSDMPSSSLSYHIHAEEREAARLAALVGRVLDGSIDEYSGPEKHELACAVDNRHEDEATASVCRASRATAAATMFADSFSRIDESRLLFIASHVAQVLDNHLLFQSRRRELEFDHDVLAAFGVDSFLVDLLDRSHTTLFRIQSSLLYLFQRALCQNGQDIRRVQCIAIPHKEILDKAAGHFLSGQRTRFSAAAFWIEATANERVLPSILKSLDKNRSITRIKETDEWGDELEFAPGSTIDVGELARDARATLTFYSRKASDPKHLRYDERLEFHLHLHQTLPSLCDPRELWIAVEVWDGVLRHLHQATGIEPQ